MKGTILENETFFKGYIEGFNDAMNHIFKKLKEDK